MKKSKKKDVGDLIGFILEYVIKNDVVDVDVASFWTDHASDINSSKNSSQTAAKIQVWMKFVKEKIGARKYYEIRKEYDNYCKDDCGFSNDADFDMLLQQMFDVIS